jgi:peptidoglycan-associated lipoprotein
MKANLLPRCALTVVPLIAALAAATGCASTKPAVPPAQSPAATGGDAQLSPSPPPNPPPTSGTISLSADIRAACGISDEDAYFAFDSATIESQDVRPLDAVARCFTTGPLKGRSMRLVGHADPRGSSEYNLVLGQRRADSVEGYLDHHGIAHSRVETTSRGSMDATGHDETGWTRDRRVDVVLGNG